MISPGLHDTEASIPSSVVAGLNVGSLQGSSPTALRPGMSLVSGRVAVASASGCVPVASHRCAALFSPTYGFPDGGGRSFGPLVGLSARSYKAQIDPTAPVPS